MHSEMLRICRTNGESSGIGSFPFCWEDFVVGMSGTPRRTLLGYDGNLLFRAEVDFLLKKIQLEKDGFLQTNNRRKAHEFSLLILASVVDYQFDRKTLLHP